MNLTKKILIGFGILIIIILFLGVILGKSKMSNSQKSTSDNISKIKSPVTKESPAFINTIWVSTSISNSNPISGTSITVQFDNQGKVTGYDGCNNFNTTYILNGTNIKINSPMASTLKACSPSIMKQANTFNELLLASTSYKLGDGFMTLLQNGVSGLTFSGQSNSLAKTSWNVTGYNNGKQAVVSPIQNTNPTMIFGDDGTISGSAGCNTYSGKYSLSGEVISISTLAATRRECIEPEGIMEQETSFLTYLEKAKSWHLQGDQLSLRTAQDQLAVTGISSVNSNK